MDQSGVVRLFLRFLPALCVQGQFVNQQIKTLNKVGIEGNIFIMIKGIYKNPELTSYFMVKDWIFFS